jgi:hypothetical protein
MEDTEFILKIICLFKDDEKIYKNCLFFMLTILNYSNSKIFNQNQNFLEFVCNNEFNNEIIINYENKIIGRTINKLNENKILKKNLKLISIIKNKIFLEENVKTINKIIRYNQDLIIENKGLIIERIETILNFNFTNEEFLQFFSSVTEFEEIQKQIIKLNGTNLFLKILKENNLLKYSTLINRILKNLFIFENLENKKLIIDSVVYFINNKQIIERNENKIKFNLIYEESIKKIKNFIEKNLFLLKEGKILNSIKF